MNEIYLNFPDFNFIIINIERRVKKEFIISKNQIKFREY